MGYGYKNDLLKDLVSREAKAIKRLFNNQPSRLWSEYSYKDKNYTIKDIVNDILILAPFSDRRHIKLVKFVEKQKNITLWDKDHIRWTKPHRGIIHNELKREFRRQRRKRRLAVHQTTTENKIKIVANEFDMELVETIYKNDTPKTDTPYQHDTSEYNRRVLYHEYKGNYKLIEGKPKSVPTFKDIAYPLRDKYLQTHTDLPKLKLKKALRLKIKEISKFIYPNRKDQYPNYDSDNDIE